MNLLKKLVLLLCVFSLSACATSKLRNGQINPKYAEFPIEAKLVEVQVENPLRTKIPQTNMQVNGGGLIGALVITAINVGSNVASREKRRDETEALWESIDKSIYDDPGKIYQKTLKNAKWMKILGTAKFEDMDKKGLKAAGEEFRKDLNGKAMGLYGSQFTMGEYFESLTQNFRFELNAVEDGKSKDTIYYTVLTDTYYPEETTDFDMENYKVWIKNNNAHFKKGIQITTKNINERLHKMIKNLYIEETKVTD